MLGILSLDKPAGITSAAAVGRVKRLLPRGTKIGHAGTLDPFATGVLLLLIGRATKWCESLMDSPKRYDATVRLGSTTATDDRTSPAQPYPDAAPPPSADRVAQASTAFVGSILQQPPNYSALKIGGRRAYDLARAGRAVVLVPRRVMVYGISIRRYEWPDVELTVDCGRGFYVRSLARELGEMLNVGGHLTTLRRTRIGAFDAVNGISLGQISAELIPTFMRDENGIFITQPDA